MKKEDGFKWLFLDLNSYFASVEQQETPSLRGKPVIVVPTKTDFTCAIAASYEAKAYGIKTGTIVKDAKKMCPGLHIVAARHDKYVAYHHRIISEVVKHTPINEICSIDELSSCLPPAKRNNECAIRIAARIKESVRNNVGKHIRCSIGFAPNALLAKIACDMKKPDGLTILPQKSIPHALYDLSLNDIPGIGKNMERRLLRAGVYTIADFCALAPKQCRNIWRSVEGERMWYKLHGYDIPTAETKTSVIGHSRVIDPAQRHHEKARSIGKTLLLKAAKRLRDKEFFAQNIAVSVRDANGFKVFSIRGLPATNDTAFLTRSFLLMWDNLIVDIAQKYMCSMRDIYIKKISVTLYGLVSKDMITGDLFLDQPPDAYQKNNRGSLSVKNTALSKAIDLLQEKYKKEVVSIGPQPILEAEYIGAKIAFSRVPEQKEFWS